MNSCESVKFCDHADINCDAGGDARDVGDEQVMMMMMMMMIMNMMMMMMMMIMIMMTMMMITMRVKKMVRMMMARVQVIFWKPLGEDRKRLSIPTTSILTL